ncbi:MAG: large conductance mechanosensitive channel protein MscL, partial [Clostridia bacterium]
MNKFFKEFKAFISRGNIMDMAVGVIIGGAFGKIVSSLVNDLIMPLITWALGASSLSSLSVVLRTKTDAIGNIVPTLTWNYGAFIQTVIDFLIIAFCIFLVLKLVMKSQEALGHLAKE